MQVMEIVGSTTTAYLGGAVLYSRALTNPTNGTTMCTLVASAFTVLDVGAPGCGWKRRVQDRMATVLPLVVRLHMQIVLPATQFF